MPNNPTSIRDVSHLEDLLSTPSAGVVETLARHRGDVVLLGVGGKMGPTLARMVRRGADEADGSRAGRRVLAVSRFSNDTLPNQLASQGIVPMRCDLLDADAVRELPLAPLVIYMTGMKFGSTGQEALTWAMNVAVPGNVATHYRNSRIVAFSTGNVYGTSPVVRGGAREHDALAPIGDYAQSCLGRERMLEHVALKHGTPTAIIRLNYACETRYGVLVDIAQQVRAGQPVSLAMGAFNVIWQADANAHTIQAFDLAASPAVPLNVTGPETMSIRRVAEVYGELFGCPVRFEGEESPDALISNAQRAISHFGYPRVSPQQMQRWIADWLTRQQPTLNKPTHFEVRDGKF